MQRPLRRQGWARGRQRSPKTPGSCPPRHRVRALVSKGEARVSSPERSAGPENTEAVHAGQPGCGAGHRGHPCRDARKGAAPGPRMTEPRRLAPFAVRVPGAAEAGRPGHFPSGKRPGVTGAGDRGSAAMSAPFVYALLQGCVLRQILRQKHARPRAIPRHLVLQCRQRLKFRLRPKIVDQRDLDRLAI